MSRHNRLRVVGKKGENKSGGKSDAGDYCLWWTLRGFKQFKEFITLRHHLVYVNLCISYRKIRPTSCPKPSMFAINICPTVPFVSSFTLSSEFVTDGGKRLIAFPTFE